jgi:signal transduction histidine kinase
VKFRSPSLWDEYKLTVLAAIAVLAFQSLLILRLLYERRARQRAEVESRQNLALAADANRRETMSALATSIGHELAQPLSVVTLNAQALQRMVAVRQVAPGEMGEILADIEAGAFLASQILDRHRAMLQSHQLQKKPIDLRAVIDVSFSLLAHDMRTRQIEASLDLSSTPCVVDGDPVLLQQVLLNLVRNAMEALAEKPPSRRRIMIRGTVKTSTVEVSVSDTGTGLPADIIDRLFTPFVTTKSNGLGIGLTIVQSIVDAHGGAIDANRNPDGGATFTFTLPRSPLSLSTA